MSAVDWERFLHDRREWLLTLGVLAVGAGFLAIGLGWLGAARRDTVPEQFPYVISGGIAGAALVLVGIGFLVVRVLQANREATEREIAELREEIAVLRSPVSGDGHRRSGDLVLVGASSYHLPECHLVQNRTEADEVPLDVAHERELSPCRVCHPPA